MDRLAELDPVVDTSRYGAEHRDNEPAVQLDHDGDEQRRVDERGEIPTVRTRPRQNSRMPVMGDQFPHHFNPPTQQN